MQPDRSANAAASSSGQGRRQQRSQVGQPPPPSAAPATMCPASWTCGDREPSVAVAGYAAGCAGCTVARPVPDEADVHAQAAVDARAGEADEDAIGDRGPGWVLGRAVEADLAGREQRERGLMDLCEDDAVSSRPTLLSGFERSFLNRASLSSTSDILAALQAGNDLETPGESGSRGRWRCVRRCVMLAAGLLLRGRRGRGFARTRAGRRSLVCSCTAPSQLVRGRPLLLCATPVIGAARKCRRSGAAPAHSGGPARPTGSAMRPLSAISPPLPAPGRAVAAAAANPHRVTPVRLS